MEKQEILIPSEGESKIDIFKKKEIRKVFHENEWWFSVKDVLESLTDTTDGTRYSSYLRAKDPGLKERWSEITSTLPFQSGRGVQKTTFIDIEGIFRLIQPIPSQKVEPFKKWLAKVGLERLQEIKNPELAIKRAMTLYRAKGYDDEWIEQRIRNKASRDMLTDEWDKRGMKDYIGLLTDAVSIKTFGINIKAHKRIKNIKSQSLRDNMTPIELTLNTLGEQTTREIIKATDPDSLREHKKAAEQGGRIAGDARKKIEQVTGNKVVSGTNYLTERQRRNNDKSENEFSSIINTLIDVPMEKKETTSAEKPLKIDEDFDSIMPMIAKANIPKG